MVCMLQEVYSWTFVIVWMVSESDIVMLHADEVAAYQKRKAEKELAGEKL
jgi:hypothetical protein